MYMSILMKVLGIFMIIFLFFPIIPQNRLLSRLLMLLPESKTRLRPQHQIPLKAPYILLIKHPASIQL